MRRIAQQISPLPQAKHSTLITEWSFNHNHCSTLNLIYILYLNMTPVCLRQQGRLSL